LMMSLWDALRMNMMISYQELVRTFPKVTLNNGNDVLCAVVTLTINDMITPVFVLCGKNTIITYNIKRATYPLVLRTEHGFKNHKPWHSLVKWE
ncbi:hypothetical protein, partial [Klebsiella pneumoniae]|uniref:hypothetical protein n=1 Tax=Klebsiella pneumoniae TaxID=573 RepID=UPI00319EAE57